MGNHCIDVVCAGCGRTWCLRECSDRTGPNPELAKIAQTNHARKPAYVFSGPGYHEVRECCPGFPVLGHSVLYSDNNPPARKTAWDRIAAPDQFKDPCPT
jgi:hypothetical protein